MSSLKDSWKETGTEFGHAFRDLGKTVIKTAKTGADKVEDWAMQDDNQKQSSSEPKQPVEAPQTETPQTESPQMESLQMKSPQAETPQTGSSQAESPQMENQQSTSTQNAEQQGGLKNDWKNTGVGLGHAFRDLGKTVIKSAKTGADKAEAWATQDDEPKK